MRLIVATRSSGPPASGEIIKEMPVSVASGTHCIILKTNAVFLLLINLFDFFWYQSTRFGTPYILWVPCSAHSSQALITVNFVSVLPT